MKDVLELINEPVPLHLRNAVTGMMTDMGYGRDYKYSHDYEGHFEAQEYLPSSLNGKRYYLPSDQGAEKRIGDRLNQWWGSRTKRSND